MVIVPRVCTYVRLQRLLNYQVLLSSVKHGDCPQNRYVKLQRLLDYQVLLSSVKHGDCPQSMYVCQITEVVGLSSIT